MSKLSRAVLVQLAVIAAVAGVLIWVSRALPLVEWITSTQQRLGQLGFWSAVLYPALLACCNLLLLPGGVIAVGSGLFFGLWWGFLLVWLGTLCGAAAAFWIGRSLGRQWVERVLRKRSKWMILDAAIQREGWKIVFLSQVHPLFPTSLLNYLYGVTKMRFWPCMLWIAVAQAPGLFLYTYLGTLAQHGIRLVRGESHPEAVEYALWFGGLLVTVVCTTALARLGVRMLREAEAHDPETTDRQTDKKKILAGTLRP